ncbi:hypothetical protein TcasGA2_TC010282 [Tribolium castaneum]|uniref:Uncharacterized protein n=1 Tax=Tribolium castaneum TaxID=7070 RepID=D7EJJ2_TRICA|nr:hypothetical protein TcasGA2_TC010282 [Tribolium castaneum]
MIASLLEYLNTKERDHRGPFVSLNDVQDIKNSGAETLKVSLRTVNTITRMVKTEGPPKPPKRVPLRKRPVTDISDPEKCDIQECLYEWWRTRALMPAASRPSDQNQNFMSSETMGVKVGYAHWQLESIGEGGLCTPGEMKRNDQ